MTLNGIIEAILSINPIITICILFFFIFISYSIKFIWKFLSFNALPDFKKYGEWAVITGATDGIGKAYAFNLAKSGLNIVLISRTLCKLQSVSKEIENKYRVKTKIIDADFTKNDIYDKIQNEVIDLDVGVLVNNVGMSYKYPEYFTKVEKGREYFMNLINCNITSLTMMTYIILPSMVSKRKGVIINLSSISGTVPCALLTVYGASKAYVQHFSLSLSLEYKQKGIIVQTVVPSYVATNMSGIKRPTLMVPSPQDFVSASLKRLTWLHYTGGCWTHDIQLFGLSVLSATVPAIKNFIMQSILGRARKKVLMKKNQNNKTD